MSVPVTRADIDTWFLSGIIALTTTGAEGLGPAPRRDGFLKGVAVPYDVFIECDKRPQVTIDADRVEELEGYFRFFKEGELVASFKEQKVYGYVKMIIPM